MCVLDFLFDGRRRKCILVTFIGVSYKILMGELVRAIIFFFFFIDYIDILYTATEYPITFLFTWHDLFILQSIPNASKLHTEIL